MSALRSILPLFFALLFSTLPAGAIEVRGQNFLGIFNKILDNEVPRSGIGTLWGNQDHRTFETPHRFRVDNPFAFTISEVKVTSSNPESFPVSSLPTLLGSGQQEEFTVTFAPRVTGVITADIVITYLANGISEDFRFFVRGTGTGPDVAVAGGAGLVVCISRIVVIEHGVRGHLRSSTLRCRVFREAWNSTLECRATKTRR